MNKAPLRRSQKIHKYIISNDYTDYLHEFDVGINYDPITLQEAINSFWTSQWMDAIHDKSTSMNYNNVLNLVELPIDCKPIDYKWVFKTKYDAARNIKRYKVRLVAKSFTQRGCINYKETFSHVSIKD